MSQYALRISEEQAKEIPMVDLAFELLKSANTPFYYRDLMAEIAKLKGLSDDQVMQVIAQLYTEINIDGRFACVGTNLWGLKRWYPVEKSEDAVGSGKRPRIINDDDDDDMDDEELYAEEEEETYAGDEDEFDAFDADREEFDTAEESEEEAELFEEEESEDADAGVDSSEGGGEEFDNADSDEEDGDYEDDDK